MIERGMKVLYLAISVTVTCVDHVAEVSLGTVRMTSNVA